VHNLGVRIVVSGASGLIGSALVPALESADHEVLRLVRRQASAPNEVSWDPAAGAIDSARLVGVEAGVNLNGATVGKRWTANRKKEILASRIESTRLLSTTLASLEPRPSVLVCAGGVGIYGYDRGDEILTEQSELGAGFLAEVGSAWEAAADPAREAGIRVVNFRQGIVLSRGGGALPRLLTPFKLGLGGRVGSGRQWWPWVAAEDLVAGYLLALEGDLAGPVNLTSPNPVTNAQLTKALGKVLKRPTVFALPAFGARLAFGEMAEEVLLGGQRVLPVRLLDAGFSFRYAHIDDALVHALAA
jgi:uncharacterized protein (TIGR01777 family)